MKYLFLLGCSLIAAVPAMAQDAAAVAAEPDGETICAGECMTRRIMPGDITVLGSGHVQRIEQTGQSISVVTVDELAAIQGPDLSRVLERLPGVSLSRDGGLGATTALRVRGAESSQVLVLIDGVRVGDYASPGGAYDLGNLLPGSLSKVELLRGSNSVVWGSQAIGGVLAVTTRETDGAEASAEYGAYDTVNLTGSTGVARHDHALSVSAGFARTDGFSAKSAGSEPDGYRQWQVSAKGRVLLANEIVLRANVRHADNRLDIDLAGVNSPDVQISIETSARAGLDYTGNDLELSGGFSLANVDREYVSGWGPSDYHGRSRRIDFGGRAHLTRALSLTFGADSDWTEAESSYDPKQKARLSSGHMLLGYSQNGLSLAAGARVDDHSQFGSHWTFGANGSLALGKGWRLRASYGEGFKAPTLYQLYGSFVGTPGLRPEESKSYDAAVELGDRNAPLHLAASVFRRDSRNLIDFDPTLFIYGNIARARAEGFELEAGGKLGENVRAWASYTYVKARDLVASRDLARRPRNLLSLGADWKTPLHGMTLGADLRVSSSAVEYDFLGTPMALDSYAVLTLRASVPLTEKIELFGRIENVTDERYETSKGFGTPGRSAYIGARARF